MAEYLQLRATDCKHCYKCIRNCPVKAIRFSDRQAAIMPDECVLCGRCFVGCPQNAQRVRDDLPIAKELIASGAPVIASVAPSFVANYGASIESMRAALLRLGFADARETAEGATLVKQRYDELVNEGKQRVIISSCCPTVNLLAEKYYPDAIKYMAAVVTPVNAHAQLIKRERPEAKVVFIGPCISKKSEAGEGSWVDCALTFEELDGWLLEAGIEIARGLPGGESSGRARLFPVAGGILDSMDRSNPNYRYLPIDGVSRCMAALEEVTAGKLEHCFIEMSACQGSCANGPAMSKSDSPLQAAASVRGYAGQSDFALSPLPEADMSARLCFSATGRTKFGKHAIEEVLRKIGKTRPEDELNCGSCGYDTCRDKAAAVLMGKANLEMCLPYLMRKAQSFSDTIIRNTPNGIIVLDEALRVRQINEAARQILNMKPEQDVMELDISCLMDPSLFLAVQMNGQPILDSRQYLAEYARYVSMTVIRDEDSQSLIGIMRDITGVEAARAQKKRLAQRTIVVTDEVIGKQMRTVQEIASLLGETAAETKIALTKLKESLSDDEPVH